MGSQKSITVRTTGIKTLRGTVAKLPSAILGWATRYGLLIIFASVGCAEDTLPPIFNDVSGNTDDTTSDTDSTHNTRSSDHEVKTDTETGSEIPGDTESTTETNDDADTETGTATHQDTGSETTEEVVTKKKGQYGEWTYFEVEGAMCRNGEPAGYYFKKGNKNLLIFLNGGGVCSDDMLCSMNPADVEHSLPGETVTTAAGGMITNLLVAERQIPPDEGIFAKDQRNPVKDWSMFYVPYCTGDVHGGVNPNAAPGTLVDQKFVGYNNLGLFYRSLSAREDFDFRTDADILLSGSSAGSFGTLLNFDRTQTFFKDSHVMTLSDSGMMFRDEFLETCLQTNWRELFGLDDILPSDCDDCFNADGGGILEGLGNYMFRKKYPNRMIGGVVSSAQDDIMKLFFSTGLADCTTSSIVASLGGFFQLSPYPAERYPAGMRDAVRFIGEETMGTYFMEGNLHQHIFRNRFYEDNGAGMTIAEWVTKILDGNPVHAGGF